MSAPGWHVTDGHDEVSQYIRVWGPPRAAGADDDLVCEVAHSSDPRVGPNPDEAVRRAKMIAAAPELLACQTMGAQVDTPTFLEWIADRLVHVYGENPNIDFVRSLRTRAEAARLAIAKAEGRS